MQAVFGAQYGPAAIFGAQYAVPSNSSSHLNIPVFSVALAGVGFGSTALCTFGHFSGHLPGEGIPFASPPVQYARMSRTTSIKRGATLQYDATVTNNGTAVNLTGWTITSQVKTPSGLLVGNVTATVLNQTTNPGQYRLHAQTAGWRLGQHNWDIAYSYSDGSGGQNISYTESVELEVLAAVTSLG